MCVQGPGSWILDLGTWMLNLDSEPWIQDSGSRTLNPGSWIQDPGSRSLDPRSWALDPELKLFIEPLGIQGVGVGLEILPPALKDVELSVTCKPPEDPG